ncbi:UNVERIFIED_CONTAM: hypothetical protein FKN15_035207 [Acipenser sinensis]
MEPAWRQAGACQPCPRVSKQRCLCGKNMAERLCASPVWQCEKVTPLPCHAVGPFSCKRPCGRLLSCGNHTCMRECHVVSQLSDTQDKHKAELEAFEKRLKGRRKKNKKKDEVEIEETIWQKYKKYIMVSGADEDNMGDACSQKLGSAKYLRLLLFILIPCICALICLLVILLAFVGVIGKGFFQSSENDLLSSSDHALTSHIPITNIFESSPLETTPNTELGTQSVFSATSDDQHPTVMDNLMPRLENITLKTSLLTKAPTRVDSRRHSTEQDNRLWSSTTSATLPDWMTSLTTLSPIVQVTTQEPAKPYPVNGKYDNQAVRIVSPSLVIHNRSKIV